jgi:DNA (cytosine-5)-methyltransferase 1
MEGDVTNSNKIRFSTKMEDAKLGGKFRFAKCNKWNAWDTFPTQSPIRSGDDGLSTELDGVTFPKWRAESIKGYGNAIVPQVALELFKVIENLNNKL